MEIPLETQINQIFGAETEKISTHIKLRYVYDESNRWNLHIVIDEKTTASELRKVWGEIDLAREKLKLWQGTDPHWYSVALMVDLEKEKQTMSVGMIAMDMNFDTLVYLLWANDMSKDKNFTQAGRVTLVSQLHSLGIKNDVIQELEKNGKDDLDNGRLPWTLKTGPITQRRIIDALRQFKLMKDNKQVVITQAVSTKPLFDIRITAINKRYWERAKELIYSSDPKGYKKYEKRWKDRTRELIAKSIEFSGLNSQ